MNSTWEEKDAYRIRLLCQVRYLEVLKGGMMDNPNAASNTKTHLKQ